MRHRLWAMLTAIIAIVSWLTATSAETIDRGTCGEEVIWELASDGIMTISGTGAMDNFDSSPVPWEHLKDSIFSIIIEDGVTGIGDNAFSDCNHLSSVICPNSLTSIGSHAFSNCISLQSVVYSKHLNHIGEGAFLWCSNFYVSYVQDE